MELCDGKSVEIYYVHRSVGLKLPWGARERGWRTEATGRFGSAPFCRREDGGCTYCTIRPGSNAWHLAVNPWNVGPHAAPL